MQNELKIVYPVMVWPIKYNRLVWLHATIHENMNWPETVSKYDSLQFGPV